MNCLVTEPAANLRVLVDRGPGFERGLAVALGEDDLAVAHEGDGQADVALGRDFLGEVLVDRLRVERRGCASGPRPPGSTRRLAGEAEDALPKGMDGARWVKVNGQWRAGSVTVLSTGGGAIPPGTAGIRRSASLPKGTFWRASAERAGCPRSRGGRHRRAHLWALLRPVESTGERPVSGHPPVARRSGSRSILDRSLEVEEILVHPDRGAGAVDHFPPLVAELGEQPVPVGGFVRLGGRVVADSRAPSRPPGRAARRLRGIPSGSWCVSSGLSLVRRQEVQVDVEHQAGHRRRVDLRPGRRGPLPAEPDGTSQLPSAFCFSSRASRTLGCQSCQCFPPYW